MVSELLTPGSGLKKKDGSMVDFMFGLDRRIYGVYECEIFAVEAPCPVNSEVAWVPSSTEGLLFARNGNLTGVG